MTWSAVGWVALGGALGAPARYLLGHALDRGAHYGTLTANVIGSFILGVLMVHFHDATAIALWGTGFCGGLTTYSSFAVQSVNAGPRRGSAYVVATIVLCVAAASLGAVT